MLPSPSSEADRTLLKTRVKNHEPRHHSPDPSLDPHSLRPSDSRLHLWPRRGSTTIRPLLPVRLRPRPGPVRILDVEGLRHPAAFPGKSPPIGQPNHPQPTPKKANPRHEEHRNSKRITTQAARRVAQDLGNPLRTKHGAPQGPGVAQSKSEARSPS